MPQNKIKSYYDTIREKLEKALQPLELEIIDDSGKHKGHAGAREGGETHFSVSIISEKFSGLSQLERHKLIHRILKEELETRVHALAIKAAAPGEQA